MSAPLLAAIICGFCLITLWFAWPWIFPVAAGVYAFTFGMTALVSMMERRAPAQQREDE